MLPKVGNIHYAWYNADKTMPYLFEITKINIVTQDWYCIIVGTKCTTDVGPYPAERLDQHPLAYSPYET